MPCNPRFWLVLFIFYGKIHKIRKVSNTHKSEGGGQLGEDCWHEWNTQRYIKAHRVHMIYCRVMQGDA